MSTKIYDGRLLDGNIGRVHARLLEAKPGAIAIARRLEHAWMGIRATGMIDDAAVKGETVENALFAAWSELHDRQRRMDAEGGRDPAIDFACEVWLFPRRTTTLAILKTEQRALREYFDALPWVSEYAYYDNTDMPEGTTSRQWAARRRAWDEQLPGAGVPADRCLAFALVPSAQTWFGDPEEAAAHMPGLEARLARVVDNRLRDIHHERIMEEEGRKDPDSRSKGFETFFRANDAARADVEGRARIERELAPLIRKLTKTDLTR